MEETKRRGRPPKTSPETTNETRRKRKPLGSPEPRLKANVPKGMVGRWFNDVPGRIGAAMDAGYAFIGSDGQESSGRETAHSIRVGVNADGTPLYAFLMAIPQEFYEEDQAAKQKAVDRVDEAIRRGIPSEKDAKDSSEHFYDAGTSLKTGRTA